MKNSYTRCMDDMMKNRNLKNGKKMAPAKQTLDLIMQFARVYHVAPEIKKEQLCGFILN